MKLIRLAFAAGLALTVAGCMAPDSNAVVGAPEISARNTPLDMSIAPAAMVNSYDVQDIVVVVPAALRVSEANSYYPMGDIVWRGDPYGDRHVQIKALFDSAAARGALDLSGDVPVIAEITLVRFHGVTERTRFSIGGVYNVEFNLTIRNALTGQIIEGPRFVEANLPAPGGSAAIMLDQSGQTERVRMLDFLTHLLIDELSPATPTVVASL